MKNMLRWSIAATALLIGNGALQADSLNIRTVGVYNTPGTAFGVTVMNDYAYVADGDSGLRIIDISDPGNPAETGHHVTSGVRGLKVVGNYAYVAASGNGLRIIDVSDPSAPFETGFYDTSASNAAYRADGNGTNIFVSSGNDGLLILNTSDPAHPLQLSCLSPSDYTYGVAVRGNYAYLGDMMAGLRVINISNLSNPYEEGFYDTPGSAYDVTVSGDYAYVADMEGGVRIVDISDPANPTEIGYFYNFKNVIGLATDSVNVIAAEMGAGIQVINVTDPANPTLSGFYDTPGFAYGVAVSNGYIYVADGGSGLRILRGYSVLPVQLSCFGLSQVEGAVKLYWRTEAELGCCFWEIERSVQEQRGYELIGRVKGHISSNQPNEYFYTDDTVLENGTYYYRLAEVDPSGQRCYHGPICVNYIKPGPSRFELSRISPNPAIYSATINYQIPGEGTVKLGIYNIMGQLVRTLVGGRQQQGPYHVVWDGTDDHGNRSPSGTYFCRLEVQGKKRYAMDKILLWLR